MTQLFAKLVPRMLYAIIGVLGASVVLYSAVTKFTTLSALTQMGSVQERGAHWSDWSKQSTEAISNAAKEGGESLQKLAEQGVSPTLDSIRGAKRERTAEEMLAEVQYKDKVVYTASCINMMLTAFIAGSWPQYFYLWHTPKAILYVFHRWWTFRQEKQHYLLYDFCYWANGLSLVYCWLFPDSELLFQLLFMTANGPLAWSVLAFTQSLIFHSAPHMTSVFIHTSPMLLSYCIRWTRTEKFAVCKEFPECASTSGFDLVWNALSRFYLEWVVLYYIWVYIVMDHRIKARGYKTLFDRIISRGPTRHIAKISRSEIVQKTIYMLTHCLFATATMVLATFYFRSQVAHFVFIVGILAASAWNASGFYFTVFLQQYQTELYKRAGLADPTRGGDGEAPTSKPKKE